jgi:putative tryptophan/tyrosine transport system substrate-binding protein
MNRKTFSGALFALLLALCVPAEAQQPEKVRRIGLQSAGSREGISVKAFRDGLRDLGYVEGQNILIEWRFAEGKLEQVSGNAAEVVRFKVEVIVTGGSTDTRAAKEATSTIPIVMVQDNDPVASGFVASLARPGGNVTGLSTLRPETSGKRLELLKEIVPKLSRMAVLGNSSNPGNAEGLKEMELAAAAFKVQLQYLNVQSPKDLESAFQEARRGDADAVLDLGSPVLTVQRRALVDLTAKSRFPMMYVRRSFVEAGGLISYGVNLSDLYGRAATYVDKILKGAKPTDLPVEQASKFELAINLKAAKQIGLTIPPQVLARADRVIR